MTHELLPCPTCGSTFRIAYERPGRTDKPAEGGSFYLAHETSPYRFLPSEAEAAADWNRRLSSTKSGQVAVKALEWWKSDTGDFIADSIVGRYRLGKTAANTNFRLETPSGLLERPALDYWPETDAKAAAQADYESRIRSALSKGGAQ